jgi:hypothetical protein
MQLVVPFFIISIYSYLISYAYKISISKSYLITSISIIFFLIFLGKFGLLIYANEIIKYASFIILLYLFYKKNFNSLNLLKVFFLFILFLLLIWICKDFYYYKYDEFTEYGITSRLIFSENNLPSNIEYLQKGSPHKVNFISYFHYFFLKNSTNIFREDITFLSHSFLIIILLAVILSFINLNFIKKILIGTTFYFIIYTLGPGFDRLYVDTIVGLFISVVILIYFNQRNTGSDIVLLFLLVSAFPMIKPNALVIICGLVPIFLLYCILQKKVISFSIIILAILFNLLSTKFYMHTFNNYVFTPNKDIKKKIFKIDTTQSFNLSNINQYNFYPFEKIINNKKIFTHTQFKELKQNGIYHAKTFLIFNKILNELNLKSKIIEIPINIFFWFLIILLISYFVSKKNKEIKLQWLIFLYLSFIITYFIFLTYWASRNNLINDDFTMSLSWERHLGTIILGIILFLLIHYFKNYNTYVILISALIISINMTLPNSLRIFLPLEIINKNEFWKQKNYQRLEIKDLSTEIKKIVGDYSNLLFLVDNQDDPYFLPILKYELIKINTVDIQSDNVVPFFENLSLQSSKLFIITDFKKGKVIEKVFEEIVNKKKVSITNNLFQVLSNKSDKENILKNKYFKNNLSIYEISNI